MALKLKVLTLNCWGVFVPSGSQHRNERISAIAEELSKGEYDIAILQEIWLQSDYDKLCMKILPVMPYTHYFHSGVFGTGVCIFSKHLIYSTFHHRFTLNGFAHKIFQGDWFGGKSVGLARIQVGELRVNIYGTHLHAQYDDEVDEHEAHRAIQGLQLSQFIQHTSDGCDLIILGGDFNFRPDQLGYRLIRYGSNLDDAWISRRTKAQTDDNETTCDRPDNPYTVSSAPAQHPNGIRLDYIMYRANAGVDVACEQCQLTMRKIPDTSYHYSDHEGVAALFTVRRNVTAGGKQHESGELEKSLSDLIPVVERGVKKVRSSQVFYAVAFLLCVIAVVFTSNISAPYGLNAVVAVARTVVVVYAAFCMWMALILCNCELNALLAAQKDANNTLRTLPAFK